MLYNKHNLAVAKIASKSDCRPEISGVFFTKNATVATDSFRLIEISCPSDLSVDDFPSKSPIMRGFKPFIADSEMLNKIKLGNTAIPIMSTIGIKHIAEDRVEFLKPDENFSDSITVRKINGEFPKYEELMPKKKPVFEISVNSKYLAEVIKILGDLNKTGEVVMKFYDEDSAILIESKGANQEGRGLVMPIKKA